MYSSRAILNEKHYRFQSNNKEKSLNYSTPIRRIHRAILVYDHPKSENYDRRFRKYEPSTFFFFFCFEEDGTVFKYWTRCIVNFITRYRRVIQVKRVLQNQVITMTRVFRRIGPLTNMVTETRQKRSPNRWNLLILNYLYIFKMK